MANVTEITDRYEDMKQKVTFTHDLKKKKLNSCIVLNKILKISALTVTQPVMDKWTSITVSMKTLTTCDTQRTVFLLRITV